LRTTVVFHESKEFFEFLLYYGKKKLLNFSIRFEKNKNKLVKFFLVKRGRYKQTVFAFDNYGSIGVGCLVAPFLASTYPIFASQNNTLNLASSSAEKQSA